MASKHWRRTLKNLWIDKRCDYCKESLERIENRNLNQNEVIVITFDGINRGEQHIQILDSKDPNHKDMTVKELV